MGSGPGEEVVDRPGVDDAFRSGPRLGGPVAAVGLPRRAATGVGVGVDRDLARPCRRRSCRSRVGGSSRSGPRVDLDRLVEVRARGEHELGVERRLGAAPPEHEPAGAVAEDVDVRVRDRGDHAVGHRPFDSMRSFECTLATTTSSSREQLVVLVELRRRRGCRPRCRSRMRNGASSSLSAATTSSCSRESLGVEAVRDRSAGASGR